MPVSDSFRCNSSFCRSICYQNYADSSRMLQMFRISLLISFVQYNLSMLREWKSNKIRNKTWTNKINQKLFCIWVDYMRVKYAPHSCQYKCTRANKYLLSGSFNDANAKNICVQFACCTTLFTVYVLRLLFAAKDTLKQSFLMLFHLLTFNWYFALFHLHFQKKKCMRFKLVKFQQTNCQRPLGILVSVVYFIWPFGFMRSRLPIERSFRFICCCFK